MQPAQGNPGGFFMEPTMDAVQIKITASQVITARYGTLSNGDMLRTDAAFARHLVEDCAAAKYIQQVAAPDASDQPKRRAKKAE